MPADPQMVRDRFLAVTELPQEDRAAYLATHCQNDPEMLAAVARLLQAHEQPASILSHNVPPVGRVETPVTPTQVYKPGDIIAKRYKLLEQIGVGGMGAVWLAEQKEPVKRKVAIKLVKAGMDTAQVLARFEAERQALALMDHPNIARVFDGGVTEQGRPFFVMEFVKGVPLTDYCNEARLSLKERLQLFIPVCQAVQHAHQKGIIHRDLKPSNILICLYDGRPVPKVIDFGLAKAMHQSLTDNTIHTAIGIMVGTPLYMSPEQAEHNNLDVDTRTDIYSLGVILYELLTGTTPLEKQQLKNAAYNEILRLIKEVEPPRPSTRLSGSASLNSIAAQRSIDPKLLGRSLTGDLDWIVMKALDKERSRRYETANGLVRDVERFLNDQPVEASPPSVAYRIRKFATRNRTAILVGAIVVTSLLGGIVVSTLQAIRATKAERAIATTLEELQATAPAFVAQARALAAKEQFSEAVDKLDYALKLKPKNADVLIAKADLLQCQFKFKEAAEVYREALKINPSLESARQSMELCDELKTPQGSSSVELSREGLARLHLLMQKQQRPAAEMMPVARKLGVEKSHLISYWLERLKELPVSTETPLSERLKIREDGFLELDLSNTKIVDLKIIASAPLGQLNLTNCRSISDFSPLSEMRNLTILILDSTMITALSPLRGLPLKELYLSNTEVSDIAVMNEMKLEAISLRQTRISDLSPLKGLPLHTIDATNIPAIDYSPLAGAPLENVVIQNSAFRDLSFLRDAPIKRLTLFGCNSARGYSVLSSLKQLDLLVLPSNSQDLPESERIAIESLRTHPTLKNIEETATMNGRKIQTVQSKEAFWKHWDEEKAMFQKLRDSRFPFVHSRLDDGTFSIKVEQPQFADLALLKNMPISELYVGGSGVSDLEPLRGTPIRKLHLWATKVTNLEPLAGMPLTYLNLVSTKVKDISPLHGMPLLSLRMHDCDQLSDMSPLEGMQTLRELTLPPAAKNLEFLRDYSNLQWIGYREVAEDLYLPNMTAKEFWANWDQSVWIRELNQRGTSIETSFGKDGLRVQVHSKSFSDLSPFRGKAIGCLEIQETSVVDLSPVAGIPLRSLVMGDTSITDLSILGHEPICSSLKHLSIRNSKATDLSPLKSCQNLEDLDAFHVANFDISYVRGMKLKRLYIAQTGVGDISVLAGMPLETIFLDQTLVKDVSPLLQCPALKNIILSETVRNIDVLRALPNLERISYTWNGSGPSDTAEEFWKRRDMYFRSPDDIISSLAEVSAKNPADDFVVMKIAVLLAWFGKEADPATILPWAFEEAKNTNDPVAMERWAKSRILWSGSDQNRVAESLAMAKRAVELGSGHQYLPYFKMSLGMTEYRSGQYDAALASLTEANRTGYSFDQLTCIATFFQAMCQYRLGNIDKSRALARSAVEKMPPKPTDPRYPLADRNFDEMIALLAYREAEELIQFNEALDTGVQK